MNRQYFTLTFFFHVHFNMIIEVDFATLSGIWIFDKRWPTYYFNSPTWRERINSNIFIQVQKHKHRWLFMKNAWLEIEIWIDANDRMPSSKFAQKKKLNKARANNIFEPKKHRAIVRNIGSRKIYVSIRFGNLLQRKKPHQSIPLYFCCAGNFIPLWFAIRRHSESWFFTFTFMWCDANNTTSKSS